MAKIGKMPTYKTIDDYISAQSADVQSLLSEFRAIIMEAVPEAEEMQNYKVPSFTLVPNGKREHQIMVAAYKNFVSFYPFPSTVEKFKEKLTGYKLGKGSIQFPLGSDLPKELIIKMVRFRKKEILKEKSS